MRAPPNTWQICTAEKLESYGKRLLGCSFLTDEKNRSSVGATPVGAATGAATGAPEWETMAGEFEGGGGGGGSAV